MMAREFSKLAPEKGKFEAISTDTPVSYALTGLQAANIRYQGSV